MKRSEINIRDPFILPYDGKYYMYGSRVGTPTPEAAWGDQSGFDVYISDDLENWSAPKSVFEKREDFWGEYHFWAPEVHLYNGKFYMFASFKADDKCRGTHILVSDTPDGIFSPVSSTPATPVDWECLDGTLYVDKQGTPHIIFCHEWLQIGDGAVCEAELSLDLSRTVSAPRVLFHASAYAGVESVREGQAAFVTDGPFLFRCNNGDLICIWSTFSGTGYCELIAKSDNGDIDGNWSVLEQPLSAEDGGHGMIFKSYEGQNLFVMHKPNAVTQERPVLQALYQNGSCLFLK